MRKTIEIEKIRRAVANYMYSEGCSCCEDVEGHRKHAEKLAQLLNVPMYDDESGYDFYRFRSVKRGMRMVICICGEEAPLLGTLGNLDHFRCKYCGLQFVKLAKKDLEEEEVE